MKIHLIELFAQFAATFFTFCEGIVTDLLQDFYNIFTFFALIFIYRHCFNYLQTLKSVALG